MTYKRCRCPVWEFGSVNGKRVRRSLDTLNWATAEEIQRERDPDDAGEKVTVELAGERFVADCESRKLGTETVAKYKLLNREMQEAFGKVEVKKVTPDDLSKYRESWKLAPISSRKKLERMRTFFRFCEERGWTRHNPALKLKAPIAKIKIKLPFSASEMEKILWAADQYPELYPRSGEYGKKVKAFVLVLRYAGLRIGDGVGLRTDDLNDGKIFISDTQKTGTPVWVPVPKDVVAALQKIECFGTYFFWSGNGVVRSAVKDWQRTLSRVFKAAGVKGNPHRFRTTFAVSMLEKGVAIESVSMLLGHRNIVITQKHYAPWIKSRQDELEAAVRKSWK
jgi:integrase/recombinase XerD